MSKKVEIKIGTEEDFAEEVVSAWEKAEKGELKEPREVLMFEDMETLLKVLTPRRYQILQFIRDHGHLTIRQVSKDLERDYGNVNRDVHVLADAGLLLQDKDKKYFMPWKKVKAEMSF